MRVVLGFTRTVFCSGFLVAFMGCSSAPEYPTHLAFPSRTDRLVLKVPEADPRAPAAPGRLEADLAELDERGGKTLEPASVPMERRAAIDQFLRDAFGTPAAPNLQLSGDAATQTESLGLAAESLTEGSKLFRAHCQQCHGLPGDGRGPAGLFISPYPRDFRRGVFKFTTTGEAQKPRRADLLRTIAEGLPGTPMPAFALRPEQDRELLARYVTYLAIRGQIEFELLADQVPGDGDLASRGQSRLTEIVSAWRKAEQSAGVPPAPDDGEWDSDSRRQAVQRGYELFTAKTVTECLKCHADFGRQPQLRYELWGTIAKPANFTEPKLKGGSRPEDVFARIRWGIAPVGMPAHPTLTDRQVWDLVRFVKAAPYPRELPPEIHAKVYGSP
jgi:mono/diheme cytochrome c family protein